MMKRVFSLGCTLGLLFSIAGCEERTPPPPTTPNPAMDSGSDQSGIDIKWPGGSVNVDPATGRTRVKTDGVDVDAGGGTGARVRTPNVDVDAGGGRGVDVNAPGVKVDVNR